MKILPRKICLKSLKEWLQRRQNEPMMHSVMFANVTLQYLTGMSLKLHFTAPLK